MNKWKRLIALIGVSAGTLVGSMSWSVINTALPTIQKALDAGDFEKASDTVVQVKAMVGRMVGLIDGIVSYARLGETPEEA